MEKDDPCNALHLVKLCVGADTIEDLSEWQALVSSRLRKTGRDASPRHVTRMWPRRQDELLPEGSLYWVIKGLILVRQRIRGLEEVRGEDGVRRCAIVLDPVLVRVEPRPRSPFQGWRYLPGAEAPPDLGSGTGAPDGELPPTLSAALAEIGVRRRAG